MTTRRPTHPLVHETAIVHAQAQLHPSVEVGPYAVIGPHVKIDSGTKIGAHTVIEGHTTIGQDNRIFQFCSLGAIPQDKKYKGEDTRLEIGDRNTIREFTTFNIGTVDDVGVTRLGNDNWIMAYVHLAHDCQVGNHTILANNSQLAGHVIIEDWVILGGYTGIHQFCKVGAHAMTGMTTSLTKDVPPFMMVSGNPAQVHGINAEGLRRRQFSATQIEGIREIHKLLYRSGATLVEVKQKLKTEKYPAEIQPSVRLISEFLNKVTRGIVR